jgi:hypothetical protein
MEFLNQTRFIERLQFFNGQRLFAADLQGLEAFNREMRWLHNQSLHQPGIGNGFAVSGQKGDRQVTIGPGYAIDAAGREIVLTQNQQEPIPPAAGEADGRPARYDLTVSYPPDADLEETELRAGICHPPGVIRLKEEPVFCWIRLDDNGQPKDPNHKRDIATGQRLVLARADVLHCQLHHNISIAQRLSARPSKQPYVCCGVTMPAWKRWTLVEPELDRIFDPAGSTSLAAVNPSSLLVPVILPVGIQAEIDTSQCSFLTTPCYTARISGPRVQQVTIEPDEGQTVEVTVLLDGLVQLVEPVPHKFTVQVLLLAGVSSAMAIAALLQSIDQFVSDWQLVWMGLEG